jgi:hypothetical protein
MKLLRRESKCGYFKSNYQTMVPKTLNADWCYKNENYSFILKYFFYLKIYYRVLLLLHKGTLAIRKNIPPENLKENIFKQFLPSKIS